MARWSSIVVRNAAGAALATYTPSTPTLTTYDYVNAALEAAVRAKMAADGIPAYGTSIEYVAAGPTGVPAANVAGDWLVTGNVTAGRLLGNGAGITAVNASEITTGTLPAARLPTTATFSGNLSAASFLGNGSMLTGLPRVFSATFSSIETITVSTYGTFVDVSGLSVTVTPLSTASKFLLLGSVSASSTSTTGWRFARNDVGVGVGDDAASRIRATSGGFYYFGNGNQVFTISNFFVDAPATTNTVTYKIQVTSDANNALIKINCSQTDNAGSVGVGTGMRTISSLVVVEMT